MQMFNVNVINMYVVSQFFWTRLIGRICFACKVCAILLTIVMALHKKTQI